MGPRTLALNTQTSLYIGFPFLTISPHCKMGFSFGSILSLLLLAGAASRRTTDAAKVDALHAGKEWHKGNSSEIVASSTMAMCNKWMVEQTWGSLKNNANFWRTYDTKPTFQRNERFHKPSGFAAGCPKGKICCAHAHKVGSKVVSTFRDPFEQKITLSKDVVHGYMCCTPRFTSGQPYCDFNQCKQDER